jgi:hypothetical protein
MTTRTDETGTAIEKLPKGKLAAQELQLFNGRVMPQNFKEIIEFSQMMAKAGGAVPKHFRDEPGVCMVIVQRAIAWEMEVFGLAEKTYFVNDRLAFEAQAIAAVIKKWAPITERVIPYKLTGKGMPCLARSRSTIGRPARKFSISRPR